MFSKELSMNTFICCFDQSRMCDRETDRWTELVDRNSLLLERPRRRWVIVVLFLFSFSPFPRLSRRKAIWLWIVDYSRNLAAINEKKRKAGNCWNVWHWSSLSPRLICVDRTLMIERNVDEQVIRRQNELLDRKRYFHLGRETTFRTASSECREWPRRKCPWERTSRVRRETNVRSTTDLTFSRPVRLDV